MRGRIRLLFNYLSLIVIGICIYLVVLLVADKYKKNKEMIADSATIAPVIPNEVTKTNESQSEAPNVVDKESLNELPNEINVALDSIETPIDSNKSNKITPNSTSNVNSDRFPRNFIVGVKVLKIRAEPSTEAEVIKRFKEGAIIRISSIDNKWAQLENGGWAYLPLLKEQQ